MVGRPALHGIVACVVTTREYISRLTFNSSTVHVPSSWHRLIASQRSQIDIGDSCGQGPVAFDPLHSMWRTCYSDCPCAGDTQLSTRDRSEATCFVSSSISWRLRCRIASDCRGNVSAVRISSEIWRYNWVRRRAIHLLRTNQPK